MSRRTFVKYTGAAAVAMSVPYVRGEDKAASAPVLGVEGHRYECHHDWLKLPDQYKWMTTHNIAVDADGLVYVTHNGTGATPQPTVYVFDDDGRFIRAWGAAFHGGGHGIDIRTEGSEQFCYIAATNKHVYAKTTLKGEVLWQQGLPEQAIASGQYKNADQFVPTNINFMPDGGFIVGDGYGAHYLHQFDNKGEWVRTFGGPGKDDGKFATPHGNWLDNRPGREPMVVIADRANARLQYFDLEGNYNSKLEGVLSFPAHFDIRGETLLIADLHARITLLDKDNNLITHLGDDPQWTKQVLDGFKVRGQPAQWQPGKFIHPHDACFDSAGNILVAEWVAGGRVSKLRKVD